MSDESVLQKASHIAHGVHTTHSVLHSPVGQSVVGAVGAVAVAAAPVVVPLAIVSAIGYGLFKLFDD